MTEHVISTQNSPTTVSPQSLDVRAAGSDDATSCRTRILTATLQTLAQKGSAAVTTRSIAHEARVGLGTLNYHFGSKDSLLLGVLEAVTSRIIATLVAVTSPANGLEAALASAIGALRTLADEEPNPLSVRCDLMLYLHRQPELKSRVEAQHRRYIHALTALLRVAGDVCIVPVEELAELVSSSIDGVVLHSCVWGEDGHGRLAREHLFADVLAGMTNLVMAEGAAHRIELPEERHHGSDYR